VPSLDGLLRFTRQYAPKYGAIAGFWMGLAARKAHWAAPRGKLIKMKVPGFNEPMWLRAQTSDLGVFNQIFLDEDHRIQLNADPHSIIDLGANIGLASICFAQRYPNARVIAVEPEQSNLDLLRKNVAGYKNIEVVHAGVWYRDAPLTVVDKNDDKCAFQVVEAGESDEVFCNGLSIQTLMQSLELSSVGLLKVDIEGAEVELLGNESVKNWISKVDVMMVELHDRFREGCALAFEHAIEASSGVASRYVSGEYEVVHFERADSAL
jgi:FkbM family methyltransferase